MNKAPVLIAADIGGTHARLGLLAANESGVAGARPSLISYEKFKCAEFTSAEEIFTTFMKAQNNPALSGGVLACAGYFQDDQLQSLNLPWSLNLKTIGAAVGGVKLVGINDYEAVAVGSVYVADNEVTALNPSGKPVKNSARVVLGPGTGLGASVFLPHVNGPVTLTTEAGQVGFAPACDRDREIHKILAQQFEYVCAEHLLSGPGLVNLYRAMGEIMDKPALLTRPSLISGAAVSGSDEVAVASLHAFCEILGSYSGDMAAAYGARGGVYLAGGILPKFQKFLLESQFMSAFTAKGGMRSYLEAIPVNLIDHGQLGVVGAAGWYLGQRDHD